MIPRVYRHVALRAPLFGCLISQGAFSHSAGTAPSVTVIIRVTTLKTTCGIMHNPFQTQKFKHLMLAMGPRDLNSAPYSPVHCSSHSMTSFQSSELTELPAVENSQLFAQRTVRPLSQSQANIPLNIPPPPRLSTPSPNLRKLDPHDNLSSS